MRLLLTSACALTCLAQLNLNDNRIRSEGAKALAASLAANGSMTRLVTLDVQYNRLGEEGSAALRKAIEGRSGFELLV